MDRGNSKHAPRVDDEMTRETLGVTEGAPAGGRAEEWREVEPSGDEQPDVSLVPAIGANEGGSAPSGMSADDRERRSRLGRYVRRSVFPASGSQVTAEANANNAPADVIADLARLNGNARYVNVAAVYAALVGMPESDLERRF
jgi:hypothetical protein